MTLTIRCCRDQYALLSIKYVFADRIVTSSGFVTAVKSCSLAATLYVSSKGVIELDMDQRIPLVA